VLRTPDLHKPSLSAPSSVVVAAAVGGSFAGTAATVVVVVVVVVFAVLSSGGEVSRLFHGRHHRIRLVVAVDMDYAFRSASANDATGLCRSTGPFKKHQRQVILQVRSELVVVGQPI
jgi:hypothetical protein